jgi:hypothetical protein
MKAQKMEEEVVVCKPKNQFDEIPINGSKQPNMAEDERHLGSLKGGYNLDSMGAEAFGD